MTPSLPNEIKLWWHNLNHFHRKAFFRESGIVKTIFCFDCKYGEDKKSIEARKLWEEIK